MNVLQNLIDRQLGIYCRFNYDSVLRRLAVAEEESFYGLQGSGLGAAAAPDHDPPIFACRFAETHGYEHILALANEDGRVAIQDTSTVRSANSLEGFQCHNNAVFDLAWQPKHMNFVTVSGDHSACLWDLADGAPKRVLAFYSHTKSVKTAVFRPTDPSVFATGARDGHVLVWDIRAAGRPNLVLKPDNCLMSCHSGFTPKTPGSHGKRARLDNTRATSITGLVYQDDTTLLSCGECDGNIKVWDLRKNYSIYTREPLPKHSIPYCGNSTRNGYTNLIVDEARIRLYASCMDDVIYCFNISTYNALPEQRYVGHENRTFYIKTCLSPDGAYLVSGSTDKNAYIWNVKYCQPVVRLAGHAAEVTCAAWHRAALVTCSDDARHKIWRVGPELDAPDPTDTRQGRAELVPRTDVTSLPQWGALDRTPKSLKRKPITTPSTCSAKRLKTQDSSVAKKTKRCLTDLMNAMKEDETETSAKRPKIELPPIPEHREPPLQPAGTKRHRQADMQNVSPSKKLHLADSTASSDWSYITPQPGTSFMTPTKNYEKRSCKILSPKSPKPISAGSARTPVKVSPSKRGISFTTPTKNLPNFVLDGEAPHLGLMSPVKKKQDTTDWLTLIAREKKEKASDVDKPHAPAPASPRESPSTRRNSVSEKTSKSNKKSVTLLKYFSVACKDKKL